MIDWGVVSLVAAVMGVVNVGGYYVANRIENNNNRWIETREARKLK